jgi:SMI1 / KNR4 family (SUKH-1)
MFKLSPGLIRGFADEPRPRASESELAAIESATGLALPAPYREFVTQQGCVVFGHDEERRCLFDCRFEYPGQVVVREGDIAFLHTPQKVLKAWQIMTSGPVNDDDSLPAFPKDYLPVGNSAGQSQVLLELRPQPGRVWYWRETEWRWGQEDNTALGFVAENFYDFVNHLKPDPL